MPVEVLLIITAVLGTIAFSVSGALIAIENKLDLFGVIILGCITACGGGLIRDVMVGKKLAIFETPWYLLISAVVSLIVFIVMYFLKNSSWEKSKVYKVFYNITDSIGLGSFVVTGANVALGVGINSMLPVCFYGVLTACGGGLIRDIMVMKIPAIFRKHIYAVAAIIGSIIFYIMNYFEIMHLVNVLITVILVVIIRYLAFYFEWSLPKVSLNENE